MLTPVFEITQTSDDITIEIRTPYTKVADTEIHIDGSEFILYSKPYFLRLNLPGRIIENGEESATYDADKGWLTVKVPKENAEERFDGLDMLTKLLAPPGKDHAEKPNISTISIIEAEKESEEDFEFDWFLRQEPQVLNFPAEVEGGLQFGGGYGFANQRSGVFLELREELWDVIDVKDPDKKSEDLRKSERKADQQMHFNREHYLADLLDCEPLTEILAFQTKWSSEQSDIPSTESDPSIPFSAEEKRVLTNLPRRDYLLDEDETRHACLSLVDILFAYCYNHRSVLGDDTVESAWTISKISSTLSWLEAFRDLKEVVVAGFTRAVCYPLYRNWDLNLAIMRDTALLLKSGRKWVLKVLLEIRALFLNSEPRYLLNDLYITDYCVWIQSVSETVLSSLAISLEKVEVRREEVLCISQEEGNADDTDTSTASNASSSEESEADDVAGLEKQMAGVKLSKS